MYFIAHSVISKRMSWRCNYFWMLTYIYIYILSFSKFGIFNVAREKRGKREGLECYNIPV